MLIVAMPDGANVQFPDDMPPDQIKTMILQKFPDAAQKAQNEGDSAMLAAQFGGVTPEQGTKVVNAVGRMAANVPESAVNTAAGVAHPFLHPIDTAEGIGNLGKGILQKFGVVSGDDATKYADAVGTAFIDRYGSVDNVAKTLETDPVGALMDLSTILSGGGTIAAKVPGAIGKVGEVAKTVGDVVNPASAAVTALKPVAKAGAVVGDLASQTGYENIVKAAEAGNKGLFSKESNSYWANKARTVPMTDVVDEAQKALGKLRSDAGKEYRSGMIDIKNDKTVLGFGDIDQALTDIEKVAKFGTQEIKETAPVRKELIDEINNWKKLDFKYHTPEGFDFLKQKIGAIKESQEYGTQSWKIASDVYNAVRNTIADQAPTYDRVMRGYADAQEELRNLSRELSLGKNANPGTALRKLQSVMRDGVNTSFGYRKQLMDRLVQNGADTLPFAVAGQQMSSVLPRGLVGRGLSALELATAAGGHAAGASVAPYAIPALALGSPALLGAAAYGVGAAGRYAPRAAQFGNALNPQ